MAHTKRGKKPWQLQLRISDKMWKDLQTHHKKLLRSNPDISFASAVRQALREVLGEGK